jgi:predicted transcriptional regulator
VTDHRIESLSVLESEMRAVARGEAPAPADAGMPSFGSVEALARLLTAENRDLLAVIRDRKPRSLTELAELTNQTEASLLRTLERLRDAGLVHIDDDGRRRVPTAAVSRIVVEIDPFSANDRIRSEPS